MIKIIYNTRELLRQQVPHEVGNTTPDPLIKSVSPLGGGGSRGVLTKGDFLGASSFLIYPTRQWRRERAF
jgi:hypothetical protein